MKPQKPPDKKKLFCLKCHAWTEHSIALSSQRVTCLSCGDERKVILSELMTKKPEIITLNQGRPERNV